MAPKRRLPPPNPPISSSEEEDDEANSSEEEEEEEKPTKMADATRKVDSGSDSDDSETENQAQPPRSAKSTTTKVSKSASLKQPRESELKRAKKEKVLEVAVIEEDPKKKQLFQRVWSHEDEIAILKGAIEFASKEGADPIADFNGFHEFAKKSLRLDFSRDQFRRKIKRLKERFENNFEKGKRGKGHEQELYDLSKKIWGGGNGGGGGGEGSSEMGAKEAKLNAGKSKKNRVFEEKTDNNVVEIVEGINRFGGLPKMEEKLIKEGLGIVGDGGVEWMKKWRNLQVAELEVFLKRAELIKELMEMALQGR